MYREQSPYHFYKMKEVMSWLVQSILSIAMFKCLSFIKYKIFSHEVNEGMKEIVPCIFRYNEA